MSMEAAVTAPVIAVRAPIDGYFSQPTLTAGQKVTPGQELGVVEDPLADTGEVDELAARIAAVGDDIDSVSRLTERVEEASRGYVETSRVYRVERLRSLEASLKESEAQKSEMRVRLEDRKENADRVAALFAGGLASGQAHSEAVHGLSIAQDQLLGAETRVQSVRLELAAAQDGIDLTASGNEKSYAERERDIVNRELDQHRRELAQLRGLLAALIRQRDAAASRLAKHASSRIRAPVAGRLLVVANSSPRYVAHGEVLMSLVSCNSSVVVATLSRRSYDRLQIGTAATFEFSHKSGQYGGYVTQMVGSLRGPGTLDGPVPLPDEVHAGDAYVVVAEFPELAAEWADTCSIGLTGKVRFRANVFTDFPGPSRGGAPESPKEVGVVDSKSLTMSR
jgi:multidrug resistance efflux pump